MSKPGCFGAASVFSHDSTACQQCPSFVECADLSLTRLQSLSERIDVSDLIKKHTRAQSIARPDRAKRHQSDEERDTRIIQRAEPIAPIQRKTRLETVTFEIDDATGEAIAQIGNKKASAQALLLCKSMTVDMALKDMNAGCNPFPPTPKWLHIVGNMLCPSPEPVTKATIKAAFMQHLGWKEQTAASHVSIAIAMITGLGIAEERDGHFILSPSPEAHN